jgi:hypothetical protein
MSIRRWSRAPLSALALLVLTGSALAGDLPLPPFGRDTVLVWQIQNRDEVSSFVVRIAEFLPDRFIEWEGSLNQGTIFMPGGAIADAKGFTTTSLFEAGVDSRGNNVTTLWLSRRLFKGLKGEKKIKLRIDSLDCQMTLEGSDQMTVEVNRTPVILPVIKVMDSRKVERWFLDSEDNPLMVKHIVHQFTQSLASVTTDRSNTLRWIKGKKLTNPH